ncbi:hypothetical protein VP1G_07856 [Cytospora mali]|uniref:Ecp2 effector protein-like domain-containing protein n=1 Tax=Cytospora mali TaxID=578113 RepID=A0A194V9Y7_CYTMA|nr:hypothetical protein VP1G_07856 [Valsa mali var. pyri (nom. inval.)]
MSSTVRALLSLFVAQLLVTFCLAATAQFQVPGIFQNNTVTDASKVCTNSDFNVTGSDDIVVEDCQAILKNWQNTYFTTDLYEWTNATVAKPDITLVTQGTCEIAVKRPAGFTPVDDLVVIGDQDIKDLINESIELAKVGDSTKLGTVDGTMNCTTADDPSNTRNGTIDWTLRKAGDDANFL